MKKSFEIIILCGIFLWSSCEEEYIPSNQNATPQIVVEAYIEKSNASIPTYAIITRSLGFYSTLDRAAINETFVHNAEVVLHNGNDSVIMQEICLDNLPQEWKAIIAQTLGYNLDSSLINFCAYVDLGHKIKGEAGKEYILRIKSGTTDVSAKTTIPEFVPLDSVWFEKTPGGDIDSLAQMFCIINDPASTSNYYRYFTAGENEPLIPNFASVTDDVFFNGQKFKFALQKAMSPEEDFSINSGFFKKGDTIQIKWCTIDREHFDFWLTLEVSRTRQGPFATYVRINSNVENGLGIFGGQNCNYYTFTVTK
ncbi:MAG: DUF4249 domain-containing protein [Bacteroidota bacterium]|nr:DUF4249 domain-containing protein [Bacteroidota bacterium]